MKMVKRGTIIGALDILYQVLASPSAALSFVCQKRPWGWAMLPLLLTSLVFILVILPNPPELAEAIFGLERGSLSSDAWWLVWLGLVPVSLGIQAGVLHVAATLLHGRGACMGLLCGLCFASFPWAFSAPLALLRALLASTVGYLLYYLGSLALFAWVLYLYITAVRQNYSFSTRRAVATCVIPLLVLFSASWAVLAISAAL
ncbi:MAG: hypothetical protein DRI39_05835 [Chloroflexi bacterium]|nr:MAG: hypothetical protein DRI39_05835 [Chloroflexota bacterium]